MKKRFIRFLHAFGFGKSFDMERWAIEKYGAVEVPNPIAYKSFAETPEEIDRKIIEEARIRAKNEMEWRSLRERDAKMMQLLEKIDGLSEHALSVDDRIELDRLLYGTAYYRTVSGEKERLDPRTVTVVTENPYRI